MNIAWQLLRLGWQRLSDVGKIKTLWWLLPAGVAAALSHFFSEAVTSPLAVCLVTVSVFVAVFFVIVVCAGYYELEKINACPSHFKCDKSRLRPLAHLLAAIADDATTYCGYQEIFRTRLTQLEEEKGVFLDSDFRNHFNIFFGMANLLVTNKMSGGAGALSLAERNGVQAQLNVAYLALKNAIHHDIAHTRF